MHIYTIDHQVLKASLSIQIYIVVETLCAIGYFSGYFIFILPRATPWDAAEGMFFNYFLANNLTEHPSDHLASTKYHSNFLATI